jgi:hypothetical protein
MEDNLNIFLMEEDLDFFYMKKKNWKMKDNLIKNNATKNNKNKTVVFFQLKDDLNSF